MKNFKTFINEAEGSWRKETPWRKVKDGDRKDKYGNTVKTKNIAKNLARSAMKKTASGKTEEKEIDELSTALATRAAKKADKEYDHYKKTKNGAMAYHRGSQARSFKHYAKSGEYYAADR